MILIVPVLGEPSVLFRRSVDIDHVPAVSSLICLVFLRDRGGSCEGVLPSESVRNIFDKSFCLGDGNPITILYAEKSAPS